MPPPTEAGDAGACPTASQGARPRRRSFRGRPADAAAPPLPDLDLVLFPASARIDVLAQPRERRLLARDLQRALHLAALYQGDADDREDGSHRHHLLAASGLSACLRAHDQRRQGAGADPGLRSDPLLGRHHRAQLLLADPAGRQRDGQQSARCPGHRGCTAATALHAVQRAARHGADPVAAHHRDPVRRHAAHRSHPHGRGENPRRERMARVPHRVLPLEPARRLRRRPPGVRARARLLRDAGAAREPARDHDRTDHHGRGEPAAGLAAGERRGRRTPSHHHLDRRGLQPLLQPRPVVGRPRSMSATAGKVGLGAAVLAILIYLVFPVIVVLAISFSSGNFLHFPPPGFSLRWYESIASDPEWVSALWVTLKVGSLSALIATLLGVPAAFALVRHVIPAKALLSALILCALVTPPIVTALSTYLFFVPLGLVNTVAGLACAHAVSGMPFVVINTAASLRSADINLERAAVIHGAHPMWAVLRITL